MSLISYYSKVIEWCRKYVIFSYAVALISGLVIAHGLVQYAVLAILITHLTNDWGMILPRAAQTVNVHEGLSSVLTLLAAQLSESFYGRFKVILFTTAATVSGVGMLWYEANRPTVSMLIGAVALLTLGKAGQAIPLKAFLADQLRMQGTNIDDDDDEKLLERRRKFWWRFSWTLGIILATLCLSLPDNDWEGQAKISFIAIVAGFVCFLLGMPCYVYKEPSPSPLRYVTKIVKAALSKRHLDYPTSPDQLFNNDTRDTEILPRIAFLRWLDKAATLEPSHPCPEQARGRLFEVAKVMEVKNLLIMIPMWSTFLVYSLVESTGSTFFFEQADQMHEHVTVVFFVILKTFTSFIVSRIIYPLLYKYANERRRRRLLLNGNGICFGMLCSVFCCLTAFFVEKRRLSHVDIQKVDEKNVKVHIEYISVFWLTPQFFLLGLMDGFAAEGLEDFFRSQVCESMNRYGPEFYELALGFGKFVSVICILISRPLFKEDINTSRLDKYYAVLLVPATVNFCICCFVCYWYGKHPPDDAQIMDTAAQELECGIEQVIINENSDSTTVRVVEQKYYS